jgi:hypothetical protein
MNLSKTFATFILLSLSTANAIEVESSSSSSALSSSSMIDVNDIDIDIDIDINYDNDPSPFELFVRSTNPSHETMNTLLSMRNDFEEWMVKFGKGYHSLQEELDRMVVWVENHEFIERHNNKTPKPSYTVGHNHFSDMTNDEFQKLHSLGKYSPGVDVIRAGHEHNQQMAAQKRMENGGGLYEDQINQVQAEFRYLRNLAAAAEMDELDVNLEDGYFFDDGWFDDDSAKPKPKPKPPVDTDDNDTNGLADSVDWVSAGAVTPVKNQESCGSCWAFSSTGAIEGAMFKAHGELVSLSEQNLVDCDSGDQGCNGGLMDNAFKFDEAAKGLCSEADYPYLAVAGTCSSNCTKVNGSLVTSYLDIAEKDHHGLIASIAIQPTAIAMEADQLSFQFYTSGVFSEADCGATGAIDHGVLAVGYGTDTESGKKFFKVKNSWGETWGEGGYFRLDRKSKNEWGTCAILMIMTAPTVA